MSTKKLFTVFDGFLLGCCVTRPPSSNVTKVVQQNDCLHAMRKFVGYLRVSTKSQRIDGLGMTSQERLVGEYVTRQKGTLIGIFREVESGAKTDRERPALSDALALAKKLKATLIVAKLDRLSRNAEFLLRLQNSNASFVCCDCPNVDKFTVGILALVAQRERGTYF